MEKIFALDIGTRSVTGIIIEKSQNTFRVIDYHNLAHHKRSMRDGQIHDVLAVADIIKQVKETLEERTGIPLHKVCVAAAGRALKTTEASADLDLSEVSIQTIEDVKHLELTAVQAAQKKLAIEQTQDSYNNYYCVGYSILRYKLDNQIIGSLIDQKGNHASVEIIATFLPKIVVESLLAAVARADLQMEAMTLEPIAALHVLIPESMHRLNVVLVDIGAGTSDIAITNQGTVAAYGMVPIAGDEITEAISDAYLLDFQAAEQFKLKIVEEGEGETEDILGFPTAVTVKEMVKEISEPLNDLAKQIADEILLLNNKQPRAVMLIGGGSLTPALQLKIAENLDLPSNRVAVRGVDAIKDVDNLELLPPGPEFVTPVGIAIAAEERPVQYMVITVNNQNYQLFNWNELTVGDCLIQAGYEINRMYGKPGSAMIIKVNGKEHTLPGEFGTAPSIWLNEEPATVQDSIQAGDKILIEPGKTGAAASITLEELIGRTEQATVYYDGKIYQIGQIYHVNNEKKPGTYQIQDSDSITWWKIESIKDFFNTYIPHKKLAAFSVFVNKKEIKLPQFKEEIYLNDEKVSINHPLKNGDRIQIKNALELTVENLYPYLDADYSKQIEVTFNDKPVKLNRTSAIKRDGKVLEPHDVINNGEDLQCEERIKEPFIFQDVFAFVDVDLTEATGQFSILRNGLTASFDSEIFGGDRLEIKWTS